MKEERAKNGKWIKIAAGILGGLIAVYCFSYIVISMVTGDSLPMPLGFGSAVVLTGSMEDVLHPNDLIFVAKQKSYKVNDIVVWSTGGTPVVHRIIEMDADGGVITTKGDANNIADDPIPLSKVKGKMIFRIPLIGFIPRFVRTMPGMIITLVLLFTLLFLSVKTRMQDDEEAAKRKKAEEEIARLRAQVGEEAAKNAADPRSETEKEIERLKQQLGIDEQQIETPPKDGEHDENSRDA